MFKWLLPFLFIATGASAQGVSPGSGGSYCPTVSIGSNTNVCASTAFVVNSLAAVFVNVMDAPYNAVCNATATGAGTDDTAAIQAALNAGGHVIIPAGKGCYSASGVVVPQGTEFSGGSFAVTQPVSGSFISCALSVSVCVQVYAPPSGLSTQGGNSVHDLTITSPAGTISPTSVCIQFSTNFAVSPSNLNCNGFGVGYDFYGVGNYGIEAHMVNPWAVNISTHYMRVNGWAELVVTGGRLGGNTDRGVTGTNYVTFTGNGPGPNTVKFFGTQFNDGAQLTCLWNFSNISASIFSEFAMDTIHVENAEYEFCTDSTVALLSNVSIVNSTFLDNEGNGSVFNLNAATSLANWSWIGGTISGFTATGGGFNLAPTQPIYGFSLSKVNMNAKAIIAGPAPSAVDLDASWANGLTISGTYAPSSHIGGILRGGTVTNTATGSLEVDIPYFSTRACPSNFGIAFGSGGTTGLTYAAKTCYWQLIGSQVTVTFSMALSAIGSSTGAVEFINLPLYASATATGGGGYFTYLSGLTSFSGDPTIQVAAGLPTAYFYTVGASGVSQITNATLTSSSTLSGVITYPVSP